jgi:hypothetical protein
MRIKDMVTHTYAATLTGHLFYTSLKLFLLEVGTGPQLLDVPSQALILSTGFLVQETVQFLQNHHILLRHNIKLLPQLLHYQLIMPVFLDPIRFRR